MRESLYLEGNDQFVDVLRQLPAFQSFNQESLLNLLRLSKMRTYDPEEKIITEGQDEKCMYILMSGKATVTKGGKSIITLQRSGDIFGEMSLLDMEPRSATVTAEQETSCLAIDAEYLDKLDAEGKSSFHAAIYHMFAQILAYRLRVTTDKYAAAREEVKTLNKKVASLENELEGRTLHSTKI